jgi:hypothetical protein
MAGSGTRIGAGGDVSIQRFSPQTLAEVFRDRFTQESSGCLLLSAETGEEIRVHFSRGLIDLALQTGPHLEFLGDLSAAVLDGAPLPENLQKMPPDPAQLAEFLGGQVGTTEVKAAVRRETRLSIQEAFRLSGGSWELDGGDAAGVFEPDVVGTLESILKGIGAVERWAQVGMVLAAQNRNLKPSSVPLFPIDKLPLAPEEGYLLSLMDGKANFNTLGSLFPGSDPDQVTRFVYAMLVIGAVEFDPALVTPFCLESYVQADHLERERGDKERGRIEKYYEVMRKGTPYQVLGVTDGATWNDIQQAYGERKTSFQVENFLSETRHSCREELRFIETGLVEAFLKIQSLRMDAAGERSRGRGATTEVNLEDMQGKSLQSTKTSRQEQVDRQVMRASQYLAKAQGAFQVGDFHNTVEYCNLGLKNNDEIAELHSLLGQALARNPARRWQVRAEKALKRAIELDRWSPEYYRRIGELYKAQGLDQRAARYFEKAKELGPNKEDAQGASRSRP